LTAPAPGSRSPGRARSPFFFRLSIAFLAIGVIGFSTTLFIPLARGAYRAPLLMNVHGALFFAWLLLFVAQTRLVQLRRAGWHRRLGWGGAALAMSMVISGVLVAFAVTRRDLAAGQGDVARGNLVNIILEMIVFAGLVLAAVSYRRRRDIHARLLVLGTISILGPAWLRFRHFLPMVPNPFVSFSLIADAVLLVAVFHDWHSKGSVHRVYRTVGVAMVVVHMIELAMLESALWARLGRLLLGE
jgi:hypothetical protein